MSRRVQKPVSGDNRFPAIVRYFLMSRDTPALKSPESMKEHLRLFNELYCIPKYETAVELSKIDALVDEKHLPAQAPAQVSIGSTYVEETPSTKSLNEEEYRFPAECLEGDRLCDLTHELTDGTFIPPQFAHADLQVWTGHALDGRIEPPDSSFLDFSTRFYVNKFSYHPHLTFFEKHEHGTGSFKNKKFVATNVRLSTNACFTLNTFTDSYQGRGAGGSGFLSRVLLVFGTKIPTNGQPWPDYKQTKARMIADEIADLISSPPSLSITTEARKLSSDFQKWLEKEDQHFTGRVGYYFNKDALLRATFSGGVVTAEVVRRSIRWAQEQINLRKRFWPIDAATPQGILEFKILSQFETSETLLTDRTLQQALHIGKRDGKFSAQAYNWAREALLKSGQIERAGSNRNGNPVYKRRPQ